MFRVKADRCTNVSDRVKESYRIKKKRKEKHMNLLMIDNVYLLYRFRLKLIKLIELIFVTCGCGLFCPNIMLNSCRFHLYRHSHDLTLPVPIPEEVKK